MPCSFAEEEFAGEEEEKVAGEVLAYIAGEEEEVAGCGAPLVAIPSITLFLVVNGAMVFEIHSHFLHGT